MREQDKKEPFKGWNRALIGAYKKGQEAARKGLSIESCPYKDKRKPSGRLTWSRSFISAWEDGFKSTGIHSPAPSKGNTSVLDSAKKLKDLTREWDDLEQDSASS